MKAGIYLITNTANGKEYVGKDIRLPHRWSGHRCMLSKGKHKNTHLQRAWEVYGGQSFDYAILEYCAPEELTTREAWWIGLLDLKNRDKGYNINDPEVGRTGIRHTPEARRKMSEALTGKKQSAETIAKRARSLLGNKNGVGFKPTDEWRAKQSAAHRGNQHALGYRHTDAAKASMSAARTGNTYRLGHTASVETRAKISASQQGKKRPPRSDEWRRKQSETRKGKPWSDARRAAQEKRKR